MRIKRPIRAGFSLIEIMVVVGIMGLIALIGIPSIYQIAKKEGMRRAVSDMKEVINNARAKAIISGSEVQLKFYPTEKRFEITGGAPAPANPDSSPPVAAEASTPSPNQITSGTLPANVSFGLLVVDGVNYLESEWTRVRFFPNGTCDELRLVLEQPETEEIRGIELETTTGFIKMTNDLVPSNILCIPFFMKNPCSESLTTEAQLNLSFCKTINAL